MSNIRSPRHQVLRNQQRLLQIRRDVVEPGAPALASPGDMQLYSFYEPSLTAGQWQIQISQKISVPAGVPSDKYPAFVQELEQSTDFPSLQTFDVVAPQVTLDPSQVHSVYPPQGHADQPNILPHVVLNDPHLPWERQLASTTVRKDEDIMPWLAVIPFDCNGPDEIPELRLNASQLNQDSAVYVRDMSLYASTDTATVKQSATFTIQMKMQEYLALSARNNMPKATKVHIPPFTAANTDTVDPMTTVEVIFVNAGLFSNLFVSKKSPSTVDVGPYRYAAHVRNINTVGMPGAGVQDAGYFSIVHSIRTGPTNIAANTAPRSQTVHMITLEFVEDMAIPADGEYVALISLYSWTYLCQPPLSVNFVDSMRAIGEQVKLESCLLRPSDAVLAKLGSTTGSLEPTDKLRYHMLDRFKAGYSLVRYRLASGEESIAFTRSPLVPQVVSRPDAWPLLSNNGQDYQILDQQLGIMDLSYSSAWQLGKTLAASDTGFVAALLRLRGDAHTSAANAADEAVVATHSKMTTKAQTLTRIQENTTTMRRISQAHHDLAAPSLEARWSQTRSVPVSSYVPPARSTATSEWKTAYKKAVIKRVTQLSTDPTNGKPVHDASKYASSDWSLVQSWILDKLYLGSIPSHYLMTDPSFLPPESIRFFHIDTVWMDCLVDGALSVANHLSQKDDAIRQAIKSRINDYLETPIGVGDLAHPPQVPVYGFYLRSAVIHAFPNLQIEVPYVDKTLQNGRLELVSQQVVAKDILLCLMDRLPDEGQITHFRISQPPHQQCFSAGDNLDASSIEFLFRKVYHTPGHSDFLHEFGGPHTWKSGDASKPQIYDWNSRLLDPNVLEQELISSFKSDPDTQSDWTSDPNPTLNSALMGLQLNDSMKYLEFLPSKTVTPLPDYMKLPRRIYVGTASTTQDSTRSTTTASKIISSMTQEASVQQEGAPFKPILQVLPTLIPQSPRILQLRLSALTPSHLRNLGSHSPVSRAVIVKDAALPASGILKTAQFYYAIYPSTTVFSNNLVNTSFVPVSSPYAPDLIFSINLYPKSRIRSDLVLHEIQIYIPIGDPTLRKTKTDILGGIGLVPSNASSGHSPRMLSNQRFIVHMDIQAAPLDTQFNGSDPTAPGAKPAYLVLRLIPRTMQMSVPILENRTLSFKLNEIELSGVDGKGNQGGRVNVVCREVYGYWQDANHTTWVDMGYALTNKVVERRS
ncbi:hypothetical protein MMC25_003442 [Agyrium rufum]|nr:hypothetical protein [Agyrium rufum]